MKKLVCCLTAALLILGTAACAAPLTTQEPQPTSEAIAVETGAPDASAAPTAADATTGQVIDFGDDVLESLVRESMKRPTGDITVADA